MHSCCCIMPCHTTASPQPQISNQHETVHQPVRHRQGGLQSQQYLSLSADCLSLKLTTTSCSAYHTIYTEPCPPSSNHSSRLAATIQATAPCIPVRPHQHPSLNISAATTLTSRLQNTESKHGAHSRCGHAYCSVQRLLTYNLQHVCTQHCNCLTAADARDMQLHTLLCRVVSAPCAVPQQCASKHKVHVDQVLLPDVKHSISCLLMQEHAERQVLMASLNSHKLLQANEGQQQPEHKGCTAGAAQRPQHLEVQPAQKERSIKLPSTCTYALRAARVYAGEARCFSNEHLRSGTCAALVGCRGGCGFTALSNMAALLLQLLLLLLLPAHFLPRCASAS